MYKHLFGPVPSRRLGMSLGVDLVPHKVCSLNCIYCECGPTTKLTLDRKEYVKYDKVVQELDHFFSDNPDPDYITFSGAGEPTLNTRVGEVIRYIKGIRPEVSLAVLTNGTLFWRQDVRNELLEADLVLPSLDAASEETFMKINRPFADLDMVRYINGLIQFRRDFKGEIWLEVLIIPGINDSERDLKNLKHALEMIAADRVQLNTLDRPGAVEGIRAATRSELQEIVDYLELDSAEIIAAAPNRKHIRAYRKDTESAILETISRRPCTIEDLSKLLGLHMNEVNKYLDVLEDEKRITSNRQERGVFYKTVTSHRSPRTR
jgi:wyosine [tRNA(Phe)-imidazoG37] synthetase (radical SAM superfamily)